MLWREGQGGSVLGIGLKQKTALDDATTVV